MTNLLATVVTDLAAESQQLDDWVRSLPPSDWRIVTTDEGWTVGHQIGHLAWTDETSLAAVTDRERFGELLQEGASDPEKFVDAAAAQWASEPTDELLRRWRSGRAALADALLQVPEGEKVPWFGPPMSSTSMASARMMETWAHARDVSTALGIEAPRDRRARHVAHMGVRVRDYAYLVRDMEPPGEQFRVELTGPDEAQWTWGPPDARQRVTGDGYDFALMATRRLHPDDANVQAVGHDAKVWLTIVQAFAGPPGTDPLRRTQH